MKNQNLKNKKLNMKGSKGITLIALIITIIVLLILAVVAISSVNNTGIVQYAQNSKVAYIDGRDEEDITLVNYVDVLNHYKPEEKTPDPVSIEGTYGYVSDTNDPYYYIFYKGDIENGVESGKGTFSSWERDEGLVQTEFNYTVSVEGIVNIDDGRSYDTFLLKIKKDSNGNVINRMLCCGELISIVWENGNTYNGSELMIYEGIITTDGSDGGEKIDGNSYTAIDSENISSVSFDEGKVTIVQSDATSYIWADSYFKVGNIIYTLEKNNNARTGIYMPAFVIWNDEHISAL